MSLSLTVPSTFSWRYPRVNEWRTSYVKRHSPQHCQKNWSAATCHVRRLHQWKTCGWQSNITSITLTLESKKENLNRRSALAKLSQNPQQIDIQLCQNLNYTVSPKKHVTTFSYSKVMRRTYTPWCRLSTPTTMISWRTHYWSAISFLPIVSRDDSGHQSQRLGRLHSSS